MICKTIAYKQVIIQQLKYSACVFMSTGMQRKINNNNRHSVIYPGVSKQIISKEVNCKREENIKRVKTTLSPIIIASTTNSNNNIYFEPDLTIGPHDCRDDKLDFNLEWVDYKQSTDNDDNIISRNKRLYASSNAHLSKQYHKSAILNKNKMQQASDFNIEKPGNLLDQDSIGLDIGDGFNVQSSSGDILDGQNLDGQLLTDSVEVKRRMSDDYNQLDEPILNTLLRDLSGIYSKMKIIALPLSSYDIYKVVLRGWDLWGPLLLCTFLAFNLHHSEEKDNSIGPHFADVFVLIWFGSCIISLNYRLLSISSINNQSVLSQLNLQQQSSSNSNRQNFNLVTSEDITAGQNLSQEIPYQTLLSPPSMFQLMCVFGYCLVAPCFGLIVLKVFSLNRLFFERIIIGLIFGFAWPTFCSIKILIRYQHPNKRALAIYPIGLFYFVLSCMIILNH